MIWFLTPWGCAFLIHRDFVDDQRFLTATIHGLIGFVCNQKSEMESNISCVHHVTAIATDRQRNLDKSPNEFGTKVRLPPWKESLWAGFRGGVRAITLPTKETV
jgi:hypothetical protein